MLNIQAAPWWAKISGKLVLSRLPISYSVWAKVGVFRHGQMDDPAYAVNVFLKHLKIGGFEPPDSGFVSLELGPGDSILSGMIAASHGAKLTYLVDVGDFAHSDIDRYLRSESAIFGKDGADGVIPSKRDELLRKYSIHYLTSGLESLRSVPDGSVDFVWSNAVLEHVRRSEVEPMVREIRRVLAPEGRSAHTIDLRDHLAGSLHNLRFSPEMWESEWMSSSGFYTNRLRKWELLDIFERCGFRCTITDETRWSEIPLDRRYLARQFRGESDDELMVQGFSIRLE
jgi:SAM-dependent methyltransferase